LSKGIKEGKEENGEVWSSVGARENDEKPCWFTGPDTGGDFKEPNLINRLFALVKKGKDYLSVQLSVWIDAAWRSSSKLSPFFG
jgi:hypothetical protein